jgi:hypothetical protein
VKTSENASMHNRIWLTATCSARSVYLGGSGSQRTACIDSRMLSTTVASPCQTLRVLLAGDHELTHTTNSPAHQLAVSFRDCQDSHSYSRFEHYGLLVDMIKHRLVDSTTRLMVRGITSQAVTSSPTLLPRTPASPLDSILAEFSDITQPSSIHITSPPLDPRCQGGHDG